MPALARIVVIFLVGQLLDIGNNLFGQEITVLVTALIGFTFYMDKNPPFIIVAESGPKPAHRFHRYIGSDIRNLL